MLYRGPSASKFTPVATRVSLKLPFQVVCWRLTMSSILVNLPGSSLRFLDKFRRALELVSSHLPRNEGTIPRINPPRCAFFPRPHQRRKLLSEKRIIQITVTLPSQTVPSRGHLGLERFHSRGRRFGLSSFLDCHEGGPFYNAPAMIGFPNRPQPRALFGRRLSSTQGGPFSTQEPLEEDDIRILE